MGIADGEAQRVPEAEVDVAFRRRWEQRRRDRAGIARRTDPDRKDADLVHERGEEIRCRSERQVHVLDDRFAPVAGNSFRRFQQPPAAVPAHHALIEARAQPFAPQHSSQQRVLRAEILRAPEPVRVPPPQIVAGGEVVLLPVAQRAVVDVLERVVAGVGRLRDEAGGAEHEVVGREGHAVHEVGVALVSVFDGLEERRQVAEAAVFDMHMRFHRHGRHAQAGGIAQRAVAVRHRGEEIGIGVARGRPASDDAAIRQRDVHFLHRLVDQAVAEGRGLDADAGHRAANGDGLELRHHARHHAVGQRGVDQGVVGNHPLDVRPAFFRVYFKHIHQAPGGKAAARGRAIAQQIGERLVQPPFRSAVGAGSRQRVGEGLRSLGVFPLRRHPAARSATSARSGA